MEPGEWGAAWGAASLSYASWIFPHFSLKQCSLKPWSGTRLFALNYADHDGVAALDHGDCHWPSTAVERVKMQTIRALQLCIFIFRCFLASFMLRPHVVSYFFCLLPFASCLLSFVTSTRVLHCTKASCPALSPSSQCEFHLIALANSNLTNLE